MFWMLFNWCTLLHNLVSNIFSFHNFVVGSLRPWISSLPFLSYMVTFLCLNHAPHPSSHNFPSNTKSCFRPGISCVICAFGGNLVAYFQRVLTSTFVYLVILFVLGTCLCSCSAMVPLLLHNYMMHHYKHRHKCVGDMSHLFICMNCCLFYLFLLHNLSYGPPHTIIPLVPNLCFS